MSPSRGGRSHAPPPDQLWYLLDRASTDHRQTVQQILEPLALAIKEFVALSIVAEDPPLSQERLSERQRVHRSVLVGIIDSLEQKGLVERRLNPEDRRVWMVQVTPTGRRLLTRATRLITRAEAELLKGIPAEDIRVFKGLLRSLA